MIRKRIYQKKSTASSFQSLNENYPEILNTVPQFAYFNYLIITIKKFNQSKRILYYKVYPKL